MDPIRWIGIGVVVILSVIGFFCLVGVGVSSGPGYVAVGYSPTCSNCGGGGGDLRRDQYLRSIYEH